MTLAVGRRSALVVGLLLAFFALAALVGVGAFNSLDHQLLRAFQSIASVPLDWGMALVSLLGAVEVTLPLVLLICLFDRDATLIDRWLPLAIVLALNALEFGAKLVIAHHPPSSLRGIKLGFGLVTRGAFPSGHMLRATFVYGLIADRFGGRRKALVWLIVAVFLVVLGFSRVYLGDHWPDDVVGGVLLGGAGLSAYLGIRRAR